ncbi:hypothetical protein, partial [Acinetobacter baumannii]|uniref:hypothetical protein n=1 Tax=Acinetobacter baumannii TaxID=470 RepID=UPI001FB5F43C
NNLIYKKLPIQHSILHTFTKKIISIYLLPKYKIILLIKTKNPETFVSGLFTNLGGDGGS